MLHRGNEHLPVMRLLIVIITFCPKFSANWLLGPNNVRGNPRRPEKKVVWLLSNQKCFSFRTLVWHRVTDCVKLHRTEHKSDAKWQPRLHDRQCHTCGEGVLPDVLSSRK